MAKIVVHKESSYSSYMWSRGYSLCPGATVPAFTRYAGSSIPNRNSQMYYGDNYTDWRSRIAHQQQCTTILDGYSRKLHSAGWIYWYLESVPSTCSGTTKKYATAYEGQGRIFYISDPGLYGTVAHPEALAAAKSKLVKKLTALNTSFSAGTFFGELEDTIRMIKSPARGLRDGLLTYLHHGNKTMSGFRKVKDRLKAMSDLWLEYTFGWKPLINDLKSGIDAATKIFSGENKDHSFLHAKGKYSYSSETTKRPTLASGIVQYDHIETTCEVIIRAMVYRECVSNGNFNSAGISQQLGYDFASFAPTVWELIPYSFLVDYFVNISDIVSALSVNTSGVRFYAMTIRNTKEFVISDVYSSKTTYPLQQIVLELPRFKTVSLNRYPVAKDDMVLVPDLTFTIPGSNSKKWLNMAALATSHAASLKILRKV